MHEAIGRTHTLTDVMDPARAAFALHAVLGHRRSAPPNRATRCRRSGIRSISGPSRRGHPWADGHPALGGFVLTWGCRTGCGAGGELTFLNPLLTGIEATRTSTIENIELKSGRSGTLAFVTLRHEITQGDA